MDRHGGKAKPSHDGAKSVQFQCTLTPQRTRHTRAMAAVCAYDSEAKRACMHKAAQNAVLGALAAHIGVGTSERAIVLDDDDMASSRALTEHAAMASRNIVVVNFGADDKLASMRRHGVATVVAGDAHHDIHTLPSDGKLRVAYLDFCCTADEIVDGGTIPAAIARMAKSKPCLLAVTFARRNSRKFKLPQPAHMLEVVAKAARTHGMRARVVYEDTYAMYHLQWLLLPAGDDAGSPPARHAALVERAHDVAVAAASAVAGDKLDDADADDSATEDGGEDEEDDGEYGYKRIAEARHAADGWRYKVLWDDGSATWEPAGCFSGATARRDMMRLRATAHAQARDAKEAACRAAYAAFKAAQEAAYAASATVTAAAPSPAAATRAATLAATLARMATAPAITTVVPTAGYKRCRTRPPAGVGTGVGVEVESKPESKTEPKTEAKRVRRSSLYAVCVCC